MLSLKKLLTNIIKTIYNLDKRDLLWENPDLTIAMPTTTVTSLRPPKDYDQFEAIYIESMNSDRGKRNIGYEKFGQGEIRIGQFWNPPYESGVNSYIGYRKISINTDGFTINPCRLKRDLGYNTGTNYNTYFIPWKIYGIKFGN